MKKLIIFATAIISLILINYKDTLFSMETFPRKDKFLFPGVQKINDTLFVGQSSQGFYLAMEKIEDRNIAEWLAYASLQARFMARGEVVLRGNYRTSGIKRFEEVLQDYSSGKIQKYNDIWVIYISTIPVTSMAALQKVNKSIQMVLTLATTTDALITYHAGISRTLEALQDQTSRGQSLDLHSFAAKVTKVVYPNKIYMLTAPVPIMCDILVKGLPENSVFIGDNQYQDRIEAMQRNYSEHKGKKPSMEELKEKAAAAGMSLLDYIQESPDDTVSDEYYRSSEIDKRIQYLKTSPPRIRHTPQGLLILPTNGNPEIILDSSNKAYQWLFSGSYRPIGIETPYALVSLGNLANAKSLKPIKD